MRKRKNTRFLRVPSNWEPIWAELARAYDNYDLSPSSADPGSRPLERLRKALLYAMEDMA